MRNSFYFSDFEITIREVLASISIVAVLILIGVLISSKISEHQMDDNEIYNKAVKIESSDLFEYGMKTNVGNAFVYGDLQAVDTVTYPEISGEYMYIEKVKERYTMHTRTITTTVNGKPQTRTETYWTWDVVDSEEMKCNEISFCGIVFDSKKFIIPSAEYVETVKESSHVRYKYYATSTSFKGTIFTNLRNNTISDKTKFYDDMTIDETVENLESGIGIVIFWFAWNALIIVCIYGFYKLDNDWLE